MLAACHETCGVSRNASSKAPDVAARLDDLRVPAGNRLERLKGTRFAEHSIRINDQYRVTFRSENGDAYEVGIEDYHQGPELDGTCHIPRRDAPSRVPRAPRPPAG